MGTIWVREFLGGLDKRRLPVNTPGGSLLVAEDGHINRGGEFEQRAAFVEAYALPAKTFGLAATADSLFVFGSEPAPAVPNGVTYQRLIHPDTVTPIAAVRSVDRYAGKLYVVAEFEDGNTFHFYDGQIVDDWYDGRARAIFSVTGGAIVAAAQAAGSFETIFGDAAAPDFTSITVDGVELLTGPVTPTGSAADRAAQLRNAINAGASGYTASGTGTTVRITSNVAGPAPNGKAITVTPTTDSGTTLVGNFQNFSGGVSARTSRLTNLTVDGVPIIGSEVLWTSTAQQMASDIAAAITTMSSSPEYTATAQGTIVTIVASTFGASEVGKVVAFTLADGLTVDPATGLTMAGGSDDTNTFTPGGFVRTVGSKMYALSGSALHFSGVAQPTQWTTDAAGAGFIDLAAQASGFEELVALAKYQQFVAVFAEDATMIYFVDPDPSLNKEAQFLNNTGTLSPKSVTQFGDADIFYLHESGLRSLRARDSSNAAITLDVGAPIDDVLVALLPTLTLAQRRSIVGVVEPRDGRFWLAIGSKIYVYTNFGSSGAKAWSVYNPGFIVDEMIKFKRRVYLRSGDTIYVYGGLGPTPVYDDTPAVLQLPYLDGGKPNVKKRFTGYDAATVGDWIVDLSMNPNAPSYFDRLGHAFDVTYGAPILEGHGEGTHVSLRFTLNARPVSGPAKIGAIAISYNGGGDGDS